MIASTFQSTTSNAVFVAASDKAQVDITLYPNVYRTGYGHRHGNTYARGTGWGAGQRADRGSISGRDRSAGSARLIPGAKVTQTGQVGGTTGLSIRGGTPCQQILIDGVPADDIGGLVEFANLDAVGIDKIEVLREPTAPSMDPMRWPAW